MIWSAIGVAIGTVFSITVLEVNLYLAIICAVITFVVTESIT